MNKLINQYVCIAQNTERAFEHIGTYARYFRALVPLCVKRSESVPEVFVQYTHTLQHISDFHHITDCDTGSSGYIDVAVACSEIPEYR